MSLAPGARLGPYEIQSALGAGGMGEVYRAHDTKLNRDVALKILPDTFTHDPERIARFRREAQVLAALNHPHIGTIYGLDEANGAQFLVLELVEGESLDRRIARGPIPIDDALSIAKQIAEALEAAHERGIIHRDLKPANIALTDDGQVKVLDFGLAKTMEAASNGSLALANSPTITSPAMMTGVGLILGTAAYMSPEQAAGRAVDKRSDIWAFGVVLLEMLTGKPVFTGETVSHVLASVLKSDPDWTTLPVDTPAPVRRLLRRCLDKDRKRRLESAADARLELEDALAPVAAELVAPVTGVSRHLAAVAIAALSGGAFVAAMAMWALRPASPPRLQPMRFAIVPPVGQSLTLNGADRDLALSPDGTHLVYVAGASRTLMVRSLDQLDAQPLAGITNSRAPFFSPDGRRVGFFVGGELKKVSISGGPAVSVCRVNGAPRGAIWAEDNTIVFATSDPSTGLSRVPAGGGNPAVLTTPDAAQNEGNHWYPSMLPSGRGILFTVAGPARVESAQVAVLDLQTGRRKTLIRGGSQAEYVETGHLVYAVSGTLHAVRFDLAKLEVRGDPVPVIEHLVEAATGAANYALSRTGALVYAPGGPGTPAVLRSLVWVDRKGQETPITAPPRAYTQARLSPDGTRVALDIRDQERGIWIWDLARQRLMRLTFGPVLDDNPIWTPDGRRIVFRSTRSGVGNVFWQAADGTGTVERLTTSSHGQIPKSISPDGKDLLVMETMPATSVDLSLARFDGTNGPGSGQLRTEPLIQTKFDENNGEISPDGRWLAYQSNESGQDEVYARPFPKVEGGRWQVSTGGGSKPAWTRDGREVVYIDGDGLLATVPVQTTPTFNPGNPTRLFDTRYFEGTPARAYDVSPDGKQFLMIKDNPTDRNATPASMIVVLNWLEELKAKVPTK